MAIHLMTATGTQADVNAALGIAPPPDSGPETQAPGPVEAVADKRPEPVVPETPPVVVEEPPAEPVAAAPDGAVVDDHIPDTEFDPETGDPLTERASRSPRTKLQTIKHLRKRAQAAEARASHLEGELSVYKAAPPSQTPSSATPPTPEPAVPSAEKEPQEADYDTYEGYIKAVTAHETRKAVAAALAADRDARAQEQAQQAQVQARKTVETRIQSFREAHPDYDTVIQNPNLKVSPPMIETLTDPENEHGPAMAYALAKDPERCARIAALPPRRALVEMGKLEADILADAGDEPPAAKTTATPPKPTVPPPPTQVRGGSAPAVRNLDEIAKSGDIRAFRQLRQQQRLARTAR